MRRRVLDENKVKECLRPEGFGCLGLIEQRNQALDNGPIDPFCDAVGLRRVRRGHLVMDPVFGQE